MCLVFFAKYIKVSCGGNYTSNDPLNSASDFISERQEIITCTPRWCQLGKKRKKEKESKILVLLTIDLFLYKY